MTTKSTADAQEIAKFAQHANDWWDKEGAFKTLHDINPARIEFIKQYYDLKQKRVLDIGCGGGILAEAMAAEGAQVSALDAEIETLNAAKEHSKISQLSIDYHCCLIEDYDALAFDAITCLEMLEHVQDPQLVIHHAVRLLKPGGYLFLSTINRTVKAYLTVIVAAEYCLQLLPRQTHDFNKFIKPSELAAMARIAGLELVSMSGMAYNPFNRIATLQDSVAVNYLMAFLKP